MSDDHDSAVSQVLGRVEPRLGRAEERLGDGVESVRALSERLTKTEADQFLLNQRQERLDARLAGIERQLAMTDTAAGDRK